MRVHIVVVFGQYCFFPFFFCTISYTFLIFWFSYEFWVQHILGDPGAGNRDRIKILQGKVYKTSGQWFV